MPPSSSDTRVMLSDEDRSIRAPVAVSPVKLIFATLGSPMSCSPTVRPGPGTTLTAPGGTPASTSTSASINAVTGVSDAGLMITGLPQARAGATFQVVMSNGKFQGTTMAHTPTGSRTARSTPASCTGMTSP